jgi:hypothetical protein
MQMQRCLHNSAPFTESALSLHSVRWRRSRLLLRLQHVRAYGLTDDVDDGDGHDYSLPRSDQRPQVLRCSARLPRAAQNCSRSRLLNRILLMFADRPAPVPWKTICRCARAFCSQLARDARHVFAHVDAVAAAALTFVSIAAVLK